MDQNPFAKKPKLFKRQVISLQLSFFEINDCTNDDFAERLFSKPY